MNIKFLKIITVASFLLLTLIIQTKAQQPIGRIHDQVRRQSFVLYNTGWIVQDGNPMNAGQTLRDPSGIMYLMIPSTTPQSNAFFISWDNKVVQVDRVNGANVVGYCDCPKPVNPFAQIYTPPKYDSEAGIETPNGFRPLPTQIVDPNKPFGKVLITSENNAQSCYEENWSANRGLDKEEFSLCMVNNMVGDRERQIFECVRNSKNTESQTVCLIGAFGGEKEKKITQQLSKCYSQYGNDLSRYPLCMAGEATNGDVSKVLSCMEQETRSKGNVTIMGTALCYGASNLDLNPETQIIAECAVASGGEPYTFATCAGGQLTARELDKCITNGVGGKSGCFGKNNDILKGLREIGQSLNLEFGKNNDLVKLWNNSVNDLEKGPGPNNDAVKTIKNISNEVGRASNNVGKAIKKVVPEVRIKISF